MWRNNQRQRNRGRRIFKPSFFKYLDSIPGLLYWPFQETSGTTALAKYNGVYNASYNGTNTNATVAQLGAGKMPYSYNFAANAYVNINTAALQSAFTPTAGTMIVFSRVSGAGVWTDGTTRNLMYIFVDASNRIALERSSVNNLLVGFYIAGGTTKQVFPTTTTLDTFMFACTWDTDPTVDEFKVYLNRAQVGTTQTGLGAWVGVPNIMLIGARSTVPANPWSGNIEIPLLVLGRALPDAELKAVYDNSGI